MKKENVTNVLKNKILELESIPFFKEMQFNIDKIERNDNDGWAYSVSYRLSDICFWLDQFTEKDRYSFCYKIPDNISNKDLLSISNFPHIWWITDKKYELNNEFYETIIFVSN